MVLQHCVSDSYRVQSCGQEGRKRRYSLVFLATFFLMAFKQLDSLRKCHMPKVQEGLNALSQVEWQINKGTLGVVQKLWEDGGGVAGLPPLADFDVSCVIWLLL